MKHNSDESRQLDFLTSVSICNTVENLISFLTIRENSENQKATFALDQL